MTRMAWKSVDTSPRTGTVSCTDMWGVTHFARVTWRPRRSDVDAGADNVGKTLIEWEDEPPVRWAADSSTRLMDLRPKTARFTGDTEDVVEAVEGEDSNDLDEGDYVVVEQWTRRARKVS